MRCPIQRDAAVISTEAEPGFTGIVNPLSDVACKRLALILGLSF